MKKIIFLLVIFNICLKSGIYAYSERFEYMLNAMKIPDTNTNNLKINEEVYNQYNLLSYGEPAKITNNQRWKPKANGKWTKNGGKWNGKGERGEYFILGENYAGKQVHNEVFPDDMVSGTSPLEWNYVEIEDAIESWADITKYQTEEQKEYMLNSKLIRYGVEYDLTPQMIGQDKTRVENFATWKTMGSIHTKKKNDNGVYWVATFNVPPMAADADLISKLELEEGTKYQIAEDEESINIKIKYGAIVQNLSGYAKKEDIKNIQSELIIDGKNVDSISKSKETEIEKEYILSVKKAKYQNQSSVEISVKCNSILETCFLTDMPMYAQKEEILIVYLDKQKIEMVIENENRRYTSGEKPKIETIELKRVTTNKNGAEKYTDLEIAKKTKEKFICAGQVLYIGVTTKNNTERVTLEIEGDKSIAQLDELTKKFEIDEANQKSIKKRYKSASEIQKIYKMPTRLKLKEDLGGGEKYYYIEYVIPYKSAQTLNSWVTLREKNKNAFEINEQELFSRITKPYEIVIKAESENGIATKREKLDVFEAWNTIYNRDLRKYVR